MYIQEDIEKKIKKIQPGLFKEAFKEKLFSWNELETLLNLRPFVNADRCKIINNKSYTWQAEVWLSDLNTFPASILGKEIQENVCYLSDASRVNKHINSICQELETIFPGGAADAHIYFNVAKNPSDGGFGIHYDFSHNLIVQIEGRTRFQIWDATVFGDDRNVPSLEESPIIDEHLEPGDAIFVPMNIYHRALSETKRLSVSFPISFGNERKPQDRNWIDLSNLL